MRKNAMDKFRKEFENPGNPFRGVVLWMLGGRLESDELRRQIRVMKEMGLGGVFIFFFQDMTTPYLSEEWFAYIRTCCEEAEKMGMKVWLYDEDRYPSGAAGGLATRDVRFRARSLVMKQLSNPRQLRWTKDTLAVFVGKVAGVAVSNVRRVTKGKPVRLCAGESLLVFSVKIQENSPAFNGYTYLDTLNPAAVRHFIRVTHEAYKKRIGDRFGNTVPGIFTDEPYQSSSMFPEDWERARSASAPWTDKLPSVFKRRYGYDLLGHLPELFLDTEDQAFTAPRYHYHDCVTHLFANAFAREIGEWCERNDMILTGHFQKEDVLSSQTEWLGSCMRQYEYMQAPGLDLLTDHMRIFNVAKQVSSAARQFGRKWRLTETYGCTGWDFPLSGHKALGDWQAALGINLRGVHLTWYSMLGQRKRECPASLAHSPWWRFYSHVEDYFGRIHAAMTRGTEVRDLLVIHPGESMWLLSRADWQRNPAVDEQDGRYWTLSDALLAGHLDFDYGDEDILARHGRVGKRGGAPAFIIGKADYRSILVPPMVTMRRTTLELLKSFRRSGGAVIFAGEAPAYVDAVSSNEAKEFATQCQEAPPTGPGLVKAVEKSCRRVSITDGNGQELAPVLYLLREDRQAFYLFICNTGQDFTRDGQGVGPDVAVIPDGREPGDGGGDRVGNRTQELEPESEWGGYGGGHGQHEEEYLHGHDLGEYLLDIGVSERNLTFPEVVIRGTPRWQHAPVELCTETGKIFAADVTRTSDGYRINTGLPRLGSRLFLIPKKPLALQPESRLRLKEVNRLVLDATDWDIGLSEPNVLVLDRPGFRIAGGEWHPQREILRIDKAVRDHLGLTSRSGTMVQPWAQEETNPKSVPVALSYTFDVATVPDGQVLLGLEEPHRYQIRFNGVRVSADAECGWWVDSSLRTVPLDAALIRPGQNEIALECKYDEKHPGLEIIYLLGDFGAVVKGTRALVTERVGSLRLGDWVEQGLPFYAGSVRYLKKIRPSIKGRQRLFVRIPDYRGAAIRVLVDGKEAGFRAWEPYEVDVTELVSGASDVTLAIEVIGHRRNSHGPLHAGKKFLLYTGQAQYEGYEGTVAGYQLVPCGLMAAPELIVRCPVGKA